MPPSRSHQFALEVAAIGLPVLLTYAGRTLLASPAPAPALAPQDMPLITPTVVPVVPPLSPEQQTATDWLSQLPTKYELNSPLSHPVAEAAPIAIPVPTPQDPVPPPTPKVNPIEGLRLSAVLGNDGDRLAMINGKIYHIGDTIRKTLKLSEIDARNARVTLTGDDGSIYQIKREIK